MNSLIREVAQKRKSGALNSPAMLIICVTWSEQLYLLSLSHYILKRKNGDAVIILDAA